MRNYRKIEKLPPDNDLQYERSAKRRIYSRQYDLPVQLEKAREKYIIYLKRVIQYNMQDELSDIDRQFIQLNGEIFNGNP